ncbi:hypothetical protein Bhyg_03862 [Pseudolycoriella hygida]|uniref:Uncharacterized protein n=1 Tax=Pseudolycoriella hygida TaxID=35572 RepID=A0A9Q0NFI7_9DIPT|nr:hypothetical protein Bhyg_03862 [Pseudolycoriella hygida]
MEEEYEIQHYGFSIAELKQETTQMVNEEIDKACEVLVTNIIKNPQVESTVATEIREKRNNLSKEIKALLKDEMSQMDKIITEHFTIPPNVTLSTDQLKLKNNDVDEKQLQEQHDGLLKKFMALEQFMSTLRDELDMYKNMDSLIQNQSNAIVVAEELISGQPDIDYIKKFEAIVKTTFDE